tara:strand:+ start:1361 stop:1882 length:522 start_codon:yes stop_codon:yes gene_type:complete
MTMINKDKVKFFLYTYFPIILLFISVSSELDFKNLELKYFSFDFSYILIFYYSLKRRESLGYIAIFIAGLFNDVVAGSPMGISSLIYLLLCGAAAYLRNITLRPNLLKDWIFFFVTLLILNSLSFMLLTLIFNYNFNYLDQLTNVMVTFLLYLIFSYIFNFLDNFLLGSNNAS